MSITIKIILRHLHSNMVRFIIPVVCIYIRILFVIYIPIWLDLLFCCVCCFHIRHFYLHSNMVRFIIRILFLTNLRSCCIYIPIWLDLLLDIFFIVVSFRYNLHSNMVRFIILLLLSHA